MPEPIVLSWSGGKDCALSLAALRREGRFEVVALASGFCRETDRVAIHEVRRDLIREQAAALGVPLDEIDLPMKASNVEYEAAWSGYYSLCLSRGIGHVAFGDLFLADIRAYRERFVERVGLQSIFPLWGRSTDELAREMVRGGWKAVVCSVDSSRLMNHFVGRLYDESFLTDLPSLVDPCGENGEFHTFVFHGPEFVRPVKWQRGAILRGAAVEFVELFSERSENASLHPETASKVRDDIAFATGCGG
jgi:uncharacterized protein (TIGR00290 family)